MRFAKFWSKQTSEASDSRGQRTSFTARGWSDDSVEAAAEMARGIASKVAQSIADGQTKLRRYQYGDRPIPEAVVREFSDDAGLRAVVTRNVYGALVLNTREMMFIDVDSDAPSRSAVDVLSKVITFFRKSPVPPTVTPDAVVDRFRHIADAHDLCVRVYKTAGGYRGLVTSASYDPVDVAARSLLEEFGADALYVRLCDKQNSFRARLTPKPWRIGMRPPSVSFPYETQRDQAKFAAWQSNYVKGCTRFAVCAFIATVGTERFGGQFDDLVAFHDEQTKAASGLPLA